MSKNFQQKKGLTIVEVLTAVAVLSILVVMVLPGFAKIKNIQALKSTTEDVISVLAEARSETLASLSSSSYGVHFQTDKVILFKGTTFSSGAGSNKITNIISPATISSINLNNSGVDVYFNRLSGLPSTTGTITVSLSGVTPKIITISLTGPASVN
jgi:prepilin-type N-terminal cleavage/methylation domain-containing protein